MILIWVKNTLFFDKKMNLFKWYKTLNVWH